jgi:predicted Zn-dependent protease
MKSFLIIFFFSASLFANDLPDLGSSFDNLISSADEKKIKFQIMQQVFSSNEVIRDPEINDYLKNFGENLVKQGINGKYDINFFIVNDNSINAFAMLGDVIGVHTGLFFAANSESELASVLSHEIAHLSQKHLLRLFDSQNKNSYKSYLAIAVAIILARSNPQLASGAISLGSAAQAQNTLNYTRENEKEADRIGLDILNKAGYDPKGFIDFFETMQKFNEFSSGPSQAFLRTHPLTIDRISDIQNRLKNFEYSQKENSLEFYLIKSKLKALTLNIADVSQVFENELKMKNYIKEYASYFGLAYAYLRQNKVLEARKNFDILTTFDVSSPIINELEATLLVKEKKFDKAFEVYKKGINKYPYYRAFIFGLSNLLINSNQPDKAIELLKKFLPYYESDSKFYQLLAGAYNLKKNFLLEHENLSNAYYFQYDIQNAILQMDLAVKVKSDNFYDQSRAEYRLKELKREAELMNN